MWWLLGCGASKTLEAGPLQLCAPSSVISEAKVADFTRQTGVSVVHPSPEGAASCDVVVAGQVQIEDWISNDFLQPLDRRALSAFEGIDQGLLFPPFDPGGQGWRRFQSKYSVPLSWGTIGMVYDRRRVSPAPASWGDLWRPDVAGKLVLPDDGRLVVGLALYVLGEDRNTQDPLKINHARELLRDLLRQGVQVLPSVGGALGQGLGGVGVVDQAAGAALGEDWVYVLPAGAGFSMLNLAIPHQAAHPVAAQVFVAQAFEPIIAPDPALMGGLFRSVGPEGERLYAQAWEKARR